ncbi:unnamed protein product [Schistocephalus solidus]|uniref:C2H2-type domain-containing protein n=1 Tax=Schistocephalus solidus TaxID=70667 RepID=A0A183T1U9_SCHSO|nr:unnamed protein product [Schistocephalus solidus]
MQCTYNLAIPTFASNSAYPPSDSPTLTPGINSITPTIIETTFQYSSTLTPTTVATVITTTTSDGDSHHNADNTDTPCTPSASDILTATATPTTMKDIPPASTDFSCPQCGRNFNSRIGLVICLRIHRMEAG